MIIGKDDEETIKLTAEAYHISEVQARFILAQSRGEIVSDVMVVAEDGKPLPVSEQPKGKRIDQE